MIEQQAVERKISKSKLCESLGIPRASYYRAKSPAKTETGRRNSPRKLTSQEVERILEILNSERFCDMAPAEIYYTLLDEGIYLCSISSMQRILRKNKQNVQRRQKDKRKYEKPELLAERPNQLWSWDITKLKGPAKWTYFYLYVILDVFSRNVVGWLVAHRESKQLAKELIAITCRRQNIQREQLTLHSDRGAPMKAKTVALLLSDLGVTKTHSRPHVSNDNPYSESAFKTVKYRPDFPEKFGCIEDSRAFFDDYFFWYNNEHKHSGIAMLTPNQVHYGLSDTIIQNRQNTISQAYQINPDRFVKGIPTIKKPDAKVWINKPNDDKDKDCQIENIAV